MGLGSRTGSAAAIALFLGLSSMPAPAVLASAGQGREQQPLCRRAAPLPALPPEDESRQQEAQARRRAPTGGVPMPAPPAITDDSDRTIEVTGTRVRHPNLESSSPVTSVTSDELRGGSAAEVADSLPRLAPDRTGRETSSFELGRRRPEPQSGQLTAGDHDDLLNPELYARYVHTMLGKETVDRVPRVDTRRVLTVRVQDESGRPVPFANVTLTCADGNSLSLATVADGTAVFFPGLDNLGRSVRLTAAGAGQGEARTVSLSGPAGPQQQTITVPTPARAVTRLDLMVVLDTTGSMQDEIDYLKSELRAILDDVSRSHPGLDVRLGLVSYRDEGDDYVTRTYPFTGDLDRMQANLSEQNANGGGDMPEAMDQALARAMATSWRPDAVRVLLLVADAPPHPENVAKAWSIAEAARARRIQIVPVAASGVDDLAQYVMRAMAAATQSRYLFLTDDSGIGNEHAEPAVDCYRVTRLDALVRRVLDSLVSGRRVEAREDEIIRTVGTYDQGRCVLPRNFEPAD